MTRRERLRRCYFHEELDRPAVYSRTGYPAHDPSYDRLKAYLAERSELKVWWSAGSLESRLPTEHFVEPYSEEFQRRVTVLHTPSGDLRASVLEGLKGQPGLHESYFIKTRADAQKYLSLPPRRVEGDVASFFEQEAKMGDRGIVEVGFGGNVASRVVGLFGSENFALFSRTDRDLLHTLCERESDALTRKVKLLLARGVGPYFACDGQEYLVPPLHGPVDFRDFNLRYDRPILDLIHAAGGRVHIHCHGRIARVFDFFVEMGTDVLHPFEAPPMGDITPAEAKRRAGGRLCLEGNIQIAQMYGATPAQVREETEALIRDAFADRRGLIVCPTASPYIFGAGELCLPQYQAMVEAVLAWRP